MFGNGHYRRLIDIGSLFDASTRLNIHSTIDQWFQNEIRHRVDCCGISEKLCPACDQKFPQTNVMSLNCLDIQFLALCVND